MRLVGEGPEIVDSKKMVHPGIPDHAFQWAILLMTLISFEPGVEGPGGVGDDAGEIGWRVTRGLMALSMARQNQLSQAAFAALLVRWPLEVFLKDVDGHGRGWRRAARRGGSGLVVV